MPLHKQGTQPSNLIGPRSVQGSHLSPLSSSSSSSLQYAARKINEATGEPSALSCTTSCTRSTGPPQDQNRQDRDIPSTPIRHKLWIGPQHHPNGGLPIQPINGSSRTISQHGQSPHIHLPHTGNSSQHPRNARSQQFPTNRPPTELQSPPD